MGVVAAVDEIERRIRSGEWPTGKQLPSTPELCVEFRISKASVETAIRILRERKLVRGHAGLGRFVSGEWSAAEVAGQ